MQKLIFVYNANSGIGNMVLDVAHKLFSPKTYACNLCAITFDTFSENKYWKRFRESATIKMKFLHIDEFENEYHINTFKYPTILVAENNNIEEFLSAEVINKMESVEELVSAIEAHFKTKSIEKSENKRNLQ